MEYFESKLLSKSKDYNVVWLRYVDDKLCFWPDTLDMNAFLQDLNKLAPSIKFTLEIVQNNTFPTFDVQIVKDNGIL